MEYGPTLEPLKTNKMKQEEKEKGGKGKIENREMDELDEQHDTGLCWRKRKVLYNETKRVLL